MNPKPTYLLISLFIFFSICGALFVFLSFTPLPADGLQAKGLMAIGVCLLLLSAGEYLNHRKPRTFSTRYQKSSDSKETPHHWSRNPCALGNILDVLALISLFAALSFFFFPYRG